MRPGSLGFVTVVSPMFVPALNAVAADMQRRNPKMSIDQVREMILVRGIVALIDDYNLPSIDRSPDEGVVCV